MSLGSFLKRAIPVAVAAATGGPVAAYGTVAAQKAAERQQRRAERTLSEEIAEQQRRGNLMSELYIRPTLSGSAAAGGTSVTNSGFGSGFGTFLGDVGRNIITPISSIASQVLPFFGSRDQARQPASTRQPILQGTELQTTGQNEAFVGGFGNVIGQASRFLRTPGGAFATGSGLTSALSMFDAGVPKMRITRKTKRLAQQAYGLAMGDLGTALALFTQLSGLQVDERMFVVLIFLFFM